jgi:peptide/nickel transport system substrate-binding protein
VTRRAAAAGVLAVVAALLLASSGATHAAREGGTFRAAALVGWFGAIDPALTGSPTDATVLTPACGSLLAYPAKPLPAGGRVTPELAVANPIISENRRAYTFTIRRDARFSNGTPVRARDFVHTLERIFTPAMKSTYVEFFQDIVGARAMLEGKATKLSGAVAKGRSLTIRLTKADHTMLARLALLCVVPSSLPVDPEGAKAPIPSAAPYYFAEYVPGERVVLLRNRFYRGQRPRHVDRITVDLKADASAIDQVARGKLDTVLGTPDLNPRLPELARRYGVNKQRFFLLPGLATRMFFMNTSRSLFRNNVQLRQAFNFAVDRRALTREFGQLVASTTDQYLPPTMPGFRDERIYPLRKPDLGRARALAKGRTRSGKAVLYTCSRPDCLAAAQILQRNVKPIGIQVEITQLPTALFFQKLFTPREPYDLVWLGWVAAYNDPQYFMDLFDGRLIGQPESPNFSRFSSSTYNRLIARASRLTAAARYQAYGELDVRLTRDAAPAIAYANGNSWAFVSGRTGCVVMNPYFDLTSVCLK